MPSRRWFSRSQLASEWDGDDGLVVTSPGILDEIVPEGSYPTPVKLRVADADGLRRLAVAGPEARTKDLRLRLDRWEPPLPRWRGQAAPLRHVRSITIDYRAGRGGASAHVVLDEPASISAIANALIPAFVPDTEFSGAGFPLVAVDGNVGEAALSLLPTRRVPPLQTIAPALAGKHLRRSDILLTDSVSSGREAEDAVHQITVTEALHGVPRVNRPVIDLQVHNPIGRLLNFVPSPHPRLLRLDLDAGDLVIEASDEPSAPYRALNPDRPWPEDLRWPWSVPLTASNIAHLRSVESIDLTPLALVDRLPRGFEGRLAEMAAAGVILHSLPPAIAIEPDVLSDELVALLRQPYKQAVGLHREKRSVALRRQAMHDHAGFLRLASTITHRTGYRYLPTVSVIMSTMRPEFIEGVVAAMAAQTYPHVEIVVIAHGIAAPDLTHLHTGGASLQVIEVPATVPFGAALAEGVRRSSGDLITKLDDDDWYSEHHVFDLVLAWLYSRADLVGKTTEYLYFDEVDQTVHRTFAGERYHDQVAGGAMMLSRATFDATGGWRPTPNSTDRSVLIRVESLGGVSYRTHSLGYMYIRRSAKHTWERTDSQLLGGSFEQWRGRQRPEA